MPMPRFTIRRMMLVVLVVAIILAGAVWALKMRRLSQEYILRAKFHAAVEKRLLAIERARAPSALHLWPMTPIDSQSSEFERGS